MTSDKPHTVAVDFDGVIHKYSKGWQDGSIYDEPVSGAFVALEWLMDRYAVFIHTSRRTLDVANWLSEHGFPVTTDEPASDFWEDRTQILVTNRKLVAVAYIDDRGVAFKDWGQALYDLTELVAS